jgi:predicted kinase/predicted nucleotidyltransferase
VQRLPDLRVLAAVERSCLTRYVDLLADTLGVDLEEIVLFGSVARGESWPTGMPIRSDLDLLVVTDSLVAAETQSELVDATLPLFLECGRQIGPQFRTREQLGQQSEFLANVERDGICLYRRAAALLVIVTGMPASGKTTIARSLSRRLGLPLIAKDEIKERLYDALGTGNAEWSGRLGTAAYGLIFDVARELLEVGASLIVEANFFRGSEARFRALPRHRVVQIHCDAPLDVVVDRYARRSRHPGHNDDEKIGELEARFESGAHAPLDLEGELIVLDTTATVDEEALSRLLRERSAR